MRRVASALIGASGAALVFAWDIALLTHTTDVGAVVVKHPSMMLLVLATVIELGVLGLWVFVRGGWSE